MDILETALKMLESRALCDHCLGRQFALLGYDLENDDRGRSIKQVLAFRAHMQAMSRDDEGQKVLKILAVNGFSESAGKILEKMKKRVRVKKRLEACYLCENKFETIGDFVEKALSLLADYEYGSFLVGTELPLSVAEREDEFRAEYGVSHGESMRNDFGRSIGKKIAQRAGKPVDFKKPDIVAIISPFGNQIKLQVNPLFIYGKYRKLVRGIPQSKWFCSSCRGRGCDKCNWTGKMYSESVEEFVEKPLLDETGGKKGSFHASGREDIDARMLGKGRPFVVEISKPKKRFLDLKRMEQLVNDCAAGKVEVSNLRIADRDVVRKLKKGESTQKEYRVIIEFEKKITVRDVRLIEENLTNSMIEQQTPIRVLHRRADLTREKYIYDVKVKKLSSKKAEMKTRCQGGLYVKELVTGDEGRTRPSVSELLKNKAKPLKLDVLNVIMGD